MSNHTDYLAIAELTDRIQRVRARWEPLFGNDNNDAGQLVNTRIAEMVLALYTPKPTKKRKT